MKHLKKALPVIGLMTTVFALFILTALPVHAVGGLNISTTYPGTTVTAGKTTNFSLTLTNSGYTPLNAAVYISDIPTGWDAKLTGGGNQVSRVYIQADDYSNVTLAVDVPADAREGEYSLSITANADGIAYDTLDLELYVSATEDTQGMFTSQFPELQGGASASYSFTANLTNNGAEESYYSLSAVLPSGWQLGFRPASASSDIVSLMLTAGQSQSITITVRPPSYVTAGEYTIPCTATSVNDSTTLDLKVIITGNYELQMTTKDGRLNADTQAGKESPLTLVVANTGSADISNITLTSSLPTTEWAVRFDESVIDSLPVGTTKEIVAYIQPAARAVTGDYAASIIASASDVSADIQLRVAVETSTLWGVIAVVIIILLAGGLYLVFKKFGRR